MFLVSYVFSSDATPNLESTNPDFFAKMNVFNFKQLKIGTFDKISLLAFLVYSDYQTKPRFE